MNPYNSLFSGLVPCPVLPTVSFRAPYARLVQPESRFRRLMAHGRAFEAILALCESNFGG
jgi:hypothetical protein